MKGSRWFWGEILPHRRVFYEATLASGFANLLALGASLFSMQVYDRVVPSAALSTLWVLAIGAALAVCLEFVIRVARAALLDYATRRMDINLSARVFEHLLGIRMDARPNAIGTLAAQVKDFEVVRNFLTSSTLFLLADAPFALLFLAVVGLIGGPLALVPFAALVLIAILALAAQWPLSRLAAQTVTETHERNGYLIEAIDGAESVKALNAGPVLAGRWRDLSTRLAKDGEHMRALSQRLQLGAATVQQLSYMAQIVVGVYLIGDGRLSMGGLIACSILGGRVLAPIAQTANLAMQWHAARQALRSLNRIMDLPRDDVFEERPVQRARIAAAIRAENVVFRYAPDLPAAITLEGFAIAPGDRVAVVGPTGSGKSTLLKLLSGLYRPREGRVLLDGVDMAHVAPAQLRGTVGYLPQDIRLFRGTLRDNLTLGVATASDDDVLAACRLTGVDRFIARHPKGLDMPISEGGRGLSGGQRQGVALARLLVGKPDILLLDEPTSALDPALEARVFPALLATASPAQAVVWVTHKPALIQAAQRIVVVDQGRIVLDGPRDAVLRQLGAPRADATRSAAA